MPLAETNHEGFHVMASQVWVGNTWFFDMIVYYKMSNWYLCPS